MTNRDETLSLRQQILDILAHGKFTTREVADQLGVQSRAEVKQVRDAILELAREGRVHQKFSERPQGWVKLWMSEPQVSIQTKIWRACLLKSQKGQFLPADLAAIVQGQKGPAVSRDYVRRYLRWLVAEKYLIALAREKGSPTYTVAPGKEKEPAPHWNRRAEVRKRDCHNWEPRAGCMGNPEQCPGRCPHEAEEDASATEIPPSPPLEKGIHWIQPEGPDLLRAGEIITEMEQVFSALGDQLVTLSCFFTDLRQALGLSARQEQSHEPGKS